MTSISRTKPSKIYFIKQADKMLHPLPYHGPLPERFTYPFCYKPHPAAKMAAEMVQEYLAKQEEWQEELKKGKMFGVLCLTPSPSPLGEGSNYSQEQKSENGKQNTSFPSPHGEELGVRLFFIAAYSGLLAGRNDHEFFVPPVFDSQQPDGHFKTEERRISALSRAGRETRHYSLNLQRWLFSQYNMMNAEGQSRNVIDIFREHYSKLKGKVPKEVKEQSNSLPSPDGEELGMRLLPPSGTGDCCAPKLLQYAYLHGLKPVCMAEFWYGDSPKGEIRHHLQYYPACSGKCKPLLSHMLKGLNIEQNPQEKAVKSELKIIYEDEDFIVVNKPAGMPSVPGKIDVKDVVSHLTQHTQNTSFPSPGGEGLGERLFPVHRLDMATSGLLLLAKSEELCKTMQSMFAARRVKKEYVAVVEGLSETIKQRLKDEGKITISLPLARDVMNRPCQKVDYEKGKEAVTEVRLYPGILESQEPKIPRFRNPENPKNQKPGTQFTPLLLHPITGRTHQLRVHCAHPDGLNAPIKGDELYGKVNANEPQEAADRLYLHSQRLEFSHPFTGKTMIFFAPPDFCQ